MKSLRFQIFFPVACLLIFSCNADNHENTSVGAKQFETEARMHPSLDFPGKVPANLEFWHIVFNPDLHTWEDLDEWFRNELPKHEDQHYYENLESILFYHLIGQFNIDENADLQTVLYYVQRQNKAKFLAHPELYVRCLQRLDRGSFTPRYLLEFATSKYHTLMRDIEARENTAEFLAQNGHKFLVLEEYVHELKSRLVINYERAAN